MAGKKATKKLKKAKKVEAKKNLKVPVSDFSF